jgi:hypothetical protein
VSGAAIAPPCYQGIGDLLIDSLTSEQEPVRGRALISNEQRMAIALFHYLV